MLLALDVGNTNTVLGLYSLDDSVASDLRPSGPVPSSPAPSSADPSSKIPATLVAHWRVSTHRTQTADEYGVLFTNLFNLHGLSTTQVRHIIISSVVPPVESTLLHVCESYFRLKPLFVEPGIKTGMPVLVDNPAELGDFGTATTFDVVSARGEYLGGIISPGLGISADALFSRAARLGRVDIKRPPKVIGTTTVTHIQSGLYYGYIGLVDGILERMIAEMAEDPRVGAGSPKILATGGLASLIAGDSRYISTIDDMLTLEGLRLVFARNRPEQTGSGSAIIGKPSRPRKRSN